MQSRAATSKAWWTSTQKSDVSPARIRTNVRRKLETVTRPLTCHHRPRSPFPPPRFPFTPHFHPAIFCSLPHRSCPPRSSRHRSRPCPASLSLAASCVSILQWAQMRHSLPPCSRAIAPLSSYRVGISALFRRAAFATAALPPAALQPAAAGHPLGARSRCWCWGVRDRRRFLLAASFCP